MNNVLPSEFTVSVQQYDIMTGDSYTKKAQLILFNNSFEVELIEDDCFEILDSNTTRFELIVEYKNNSSYDLWLMSLVVNDLSCNDFIIKPNDDFKNLQQFIAKFELYEKLDKQFTEKKMMKKSKI